MTINMCDLPEFASSDAPFSLQNLIRLQDRTFGSLGDKTTVLADLDPDDVRPGLLVEVVTAGIPGIEVVTEIGETLRTSRAFWSHMLPSDHPVSAVDGEWVLVHTERRRWPSIIVRAAL